MKSFHTLTAFAFAGMVMSQATVTPQSFAASTFDVVIVGGGTAGLVLANRLSAHHLHVGVIDAGSYNESGDPVIDMPYGANIYLQNPNATLLGNPKYDWKFVSIPQPTLGGRAIHYPRFVRIHSPLISPIDDVLQWKSPGWLFCRQCYGMATWL